LTPIARALSAGVSEAVVIGSAARRRGGEVARDEEARNLLCTSEKTACSNGAF
jgi:hypothetical protein